MFQSAPAIAGGRCRYSVGVRDGDRWFQSAPAIAGGRCAGRLGCSQRCSFFNPRPPLLAGDANHHGVCRVRARGFNPRPPLLAGDAGGGRAVALRCAVSIRARHCWRAMPSSTQRPARLKKVSIRARHCWRAMHRWRPDSTRPRLFQSAPAIAGGRCRTGRNCLDARTCFNPRPPLLAGDARTAAGVKGQNDVSIRARHCWRAMPLQRRRP